VSEPDIILTPSAAKRVAWIAERQAKPAILRLAGDGGGRAGFLFKAPQVIGIVAGRRPDQFQGDIAPQPFVARPKDLTHPPRADFFQDPIMPNQLARHKQLQKIVLAGHDKQILFIHYLFTFLFQNNTINNIISYILFPIIYH
jgi:hypothetical protein